MSDVIDNYRIQIKEGAEHHSSVMNIYDKSAFFFNFYQKAAKAVTAIVRQSAEYYVKYGTDLPAYGTSVVPDRFEYHNNIVAFCADRGQGKTSAMLSMAEALQNIAPDSSQEHKKFWNDPSVKLSRDGIDNPVLNTRFELLGTVDPTCMESKDSLIRTIVSKMFKSASDKWNERVNKSSGGQYYNKYRDKKEALAKKFLTCFKGIDYLYREKKELSASYDDLNMLAEYGDSNNFKDSFHELISLYLEFMSIETGQAKTMLVIPIDDADLNSGNAHAIMEDIRKYCILPNVLIFMALHIGTLSRTIEQYFLKQYETLIARGLDPSIQERCHRAMERYIDKLLPTSHRVYLISIDSFLRDDYDKFSLSYIDSENKEIFEPNPRFSTKVATTYQEQLIMLIYQKTGVILCKPDYYLHEFLPESMRELNHFLYYFTRMKDVITVDEDGRVCGTFEHILSLYQGSNDRVKRDQKDMVLPIIDDRLKNLELLENYFLYSWCPLRLRSLQNKIIEGMHKTSREMKNRRTIELLRSYLKKESTDKKVEFDKSEQPDLPEGYVPFSDVIYTLHKLEETENSLEYINLIYAIRMYYTIYYHKVALKGIRSWINQKRSETPVTSPFEDLVTLTGYKIFPMMYHEKKNLPRLLFACRSRRKISQVSAYNVFLHFMCAAQELEKDQRYLLLYNKSVLGEKRGGNKIKSDFQFFDFFRPFISILGIDDFYNKFLGDEKLPLQAPCSALELICNLDLHQLLYQYYFKLSKIGLGRAHSAKKQGQAPYDMISGIYSELDSVIENKSLIKTGISFKIFTDKTKGKVSVFDVDDFAVLDDPEQKQRWKYVYYPEKYNVIPKYDVNEIYKKQKSIAPIQGEDKSALKASMKVELLKKGK